MSFDSRRFTALTPSGHVAFAPVHPAAQDCPLLANIYLNPLDWLMAESGFEMVRYADDMVVLCRSQEEAEAALSKLKGWYGYFKHVHYSELGHIDSWIRMRLRSILRKRRGGEGCGMGRDHQRWPNRYFTKLGLFCLLDAQEVEIASLRKGANH